MALFDPQWHNTHTIMRKGDNARSSIMKHLLSSVGPHTNSHDSSSQLEECRDILEDFHHGPVKA